MAKAHKIHFHFWILIIALSIVLLLLIGVAGFWGLNRHWNSMVPKLNVKAAETTVDNYYNNYLAGGQMCQVNDKLYLNYYKANNNYGLLEVSNQCLRLSWNGPKTKRSDAIMPSIYTDGTNLFKKFNNWSYQYDFRRRRYLQKKLVGVNNLNNQNKFYYVSRYNLYEKKGNSDSDNLISENIFGTYQTNDSLYYINKNRSNDQYSLVRKNSHSTETIYESPGPLDFLIQNEYVILYNRLACYFAIFDLELKKEINNRAGYLYGFNVYNNKAYLCTDKEVIRFDIKTGNPQTLANIIAQDVYIVDDTWVYIRTKEYHWYRVRQDGAGDVETILA